MAALRAAWLCPSHPSFVQVVWPTQWKSKTSKIPKFSQNLKIQFFPKIQNFCRQSQKKIPSTYPCQSVGQWVIVSYFGYSYRALRAWSKCCMYAWGMLVFFQGFGPKIGPGACPDAHRAMWSTQKHWFSKEGKLFMVNLWQRVEHGPRSWFRSWIFAFEAGV